MTKQSFETGETPQVQIVRCEGDLIIRSWTEPRVAVRGDAEVEEEKGGLRISTDNDLRLQLPEGSAVSVTRVAGDLVLKHLNGDVHVEEAHGDVVLANLASAKLGTIHGDLVLKHSAGPVGIEMVDGDVVVRHINGDFHLRSARGDVAARHINGTVSLGEAAGDLELMSISGDVKVGQCQRDANLRDIGGLCNVPQVQGDVRLVGSLRDGKHSLGAEGDIVLRWPKESPLMLEARAPQIKNRLSLEDMVEEEGLLAGRIGSGDANLMLKAGGQIVLKEAQIVSEAWESDEENGFVFGFNLAGLGARIRSEVEQHVKRVSADLEKQFGPDFEETIKENVARRAEKAAARAERAAKRAQRREYYAPPPPPPPGPPPSSRGPSPSEQLKILKMVEQGTITPEEASTLLEALEG